MSLYRTEPVLDAVVTLARAQLPTAIEGAPLVVVKDVDEWRAPTVVVELATPPDLTSISMGAHDWAVVGVQVTCVAASAAQARSMGDIVRTALVALVRGGGFATPLDIPGHRVLEITSAGDGFADTAGGRSHQWAETYSIRFT